MFLIRTIRLIKLGWINFWRNLWLSLIATFVMSLTLMTITFLALSAFVINSEIENVKSRIDYEIFLNDDVGQQGIDSLKKVISEKVEVKEIEYIDKQKAVERYKEIFGDKESLINYIEQENPLKESLIIRANDPADLEKLNDVLKQAEFASMVHSSSYSRNREVIVRLLNIIDFVEKAGVVIGLVFIVISVTVVFSIVRVAIYTRKDEIEIMKLVGATDWFVHGPFMIESALYGILAAIFGFAFLAAIFYYVSAAATAYLSISTDSLMEYFNEYMVFVIIFQFLMGLIISVSSGFFAIRKHV
ncbi:MAG: cell division protein FtsX [Patescibacteria group bacterium]